MTGIELILLVQCLYRGDLPANVACVPMAEHFLLPTKAGTVPAALPSVGAGEQQCHPPVSSAAIGIVNVHSLFLWAKRHVGCSSERG